MIVPKREGMAQGLEEVIVSFYAKGMSVSDIEEQIREVCKFDVSTATISRITSRVAEDIVAWQNRPLEPIYLIVWMDGIVFKVRDNSKVANNTVYIAVGLKRDGLIEVLGMWLGKNESAAYWMTVLTDLQARGLEDILITATDNLNGFTQTIRSVFPQSATQVCVVHQIRNSCRYVVWKDKKEFTTDMKDVYAAPLRQAAMAALDALDTKWSAKYAYAIKSWRENWEELSFLTSPWRSDRSSARQISSKISTVKLENTPKTSYPSLPMKPCLNLYTWLYGKYQKNGPCQLETEA